MNGQKSAAKPPKKGSRIARARDEGYMARMAGRPLEANPHPHDKHNWQRHNWKKGWIAADEAVRTDAQLEV